MGNEKVLGLKMALIDVARVKILQSLDKIAEEESIVWIGYVDGTLDLWKKIKDLYELHDDEYYCAGDIDNNYGDYVMSN